MIIFKLDFLCFIQLFTSSHHRNSCFLVFTKATMAGDYAGRLGRDRYYQELNYGKWYDDQQAYRDAYGKWKQEVDARDEWARRNTPAPGSLEEHMRGPAWHYDVHPNHAWWYGPRPVEESINRRYPDGGSYYWYPEDDDRHYRPSRHRHRDREYVYDEPRRYRGRSRDRSRGREYIVDERRDRSREYETSRRGRREDYYESFYPEMKKKKPKYVFVRGGGSRRKEFMMPSRYFGGQRQGRKVPMVNGKEIKVKKGWKDWPEVYIGRHPERDGIKVKRKWKDWPKVVM